MPLSMQLCCTECGLANETKPMKLHNADRPYQYSKDSLTNCNLISCHINAASVTIPSDSLSNNYDHTQHLITQQRIGNRNLVCSQSKHLSSKAKLRQHKHLLINPGECCDLKIIKCSIRAQKHQWSVHSGVQDNLRDHFISHMFDHTYAHPYIASNCTNSSVN